MWNLKINSCLNLVTFILPLAWSRSRNPIKALLNKILRVIFVECYVERLLELNLWSFWKVVSELCRNVTGQVRSKCDLLYYSSENEVFDLCWPFLTNEKTTRFLTLDSCRGYYFLPVARAKPYLPHFCVSYVWQNLKTVTLAVKILCGTLSETSDMVCVVVAAWNNLNQRGECLCYQRIYSPRWFIF